MQIPILSWLDRPVKQAIWSVFDDVNKATEALDIFNKYKRSHFKRLSVSVRHIKILGMTQPIPLTEIYSPAIVSTTIFGRIYDQDLVERERFRGDNSATETTSRQAFKSR